ncbi:MAG: lipid-A-disaccharide synthase, partial [Rhizobiales bacterium]|nr:lipid-A-disaccharide synthase [Hyphomicrobiales bacterium]
MNGRSDTKLRIALIAGEASGDHLGAALIDALVRQAPARELELFGVGGPEMEARGLASCFPMSNIAVMGPIAILRQLPKLLGHLRQAVDFVIERKPDILVIIDCPEFSHRLARRVRRRLADLPIIDYVAPSVWAWRPGRARAMKAYVDQVMALLPFEPEAYARLGGPPCHYVGHPAAEAGRPDAQRIAALRAELGRMESPVLAVMPGSRRNELKRLCNPFGDALAILATSEGELPVIIPTLPHLRSDLEDAIRHWPLPALIVTDPEDRRCAM